MTKINSNTTITSSAANTSGLKLTNLTSATPQTVGAKNIGVNATGDIVTLDSVATGFSITDGTTTQAVDTGDTVTFTQGNGITAAVTPTDTLTITARLSTDAGNDIIFGTDGGLMLKEVDTTMVQAATGIITYTNEAGATSTAVTVSTDAGNNITAGADGGAFFNAPPVLTGGSYDDVTNTLNLVLNTDGTTSTVAVPILDAVGAFLADFTVTGDTGTDLVNNHETLNFEGGDGIVTLVTGNNVRVTAQVYQAPAVMVANTNLAVAHNLDVAYPQVIVYDAAGEKVEVGVTYTDTNTITLNSTVGGTFQVRISA